MFRSNPESTTSMPRGLLVIAGILLVARIVVAALPEKHRPDLVTWRDPGSSEATALAEGSRPILYYYSADWCQPCRQLDEDVLHDPAIAQYINEQFGAIRVVVTGAAPDDRPSETQRLLEHHRINAFPTLVIDHGTGPRLTTTGYQSRRKIRAFLESGAQERAQR